VTGDMVPDLLPAKWIPAKAGKFRTTFLSVFGIPLWRLRHRNKDWFYSLAIA